MSGSAHPIRIAELWELCHSDTLDLIETEDMAWIINTILAARFERTNLERYLDRFDFGDETA